MKKFRRPDADEPSERETPAAEDSSGEIKPESVTAADFDAAVEEAVSNNVAAAPTQAATLSGIIVFSADEKSRAEFDARRSAVEAAAVDGKPATLAVRLEIDRKGARRILIGAVIDGVAAAPAVFDLSGGQ